MTEFWVVSALLVCVASLFILYPLFRKSPVTSDTDTQSERRSQNVAVYKDRLAELEQEVKEGMLSTGDFERLKAELAANLFSDVESDNVIHTHENSRMTKVIAVVSIIIVPVIAYGLYSQWGALDKVEAYEDWVAVVPEAGNGMPQQDIGELLKSLKSKLEADPENIDGWFLLARTAMNIEQYPLAATAFLKMANLLEKQNEDASAAYGLAAQAKFFEAGGRMTATVKQTVDKALKLNQDETNALGLLGIVAYESGDFKNAIHYWSRILEVDPENPSRDAIETGISRAKSQLNAPTNPTVAQSDERKEQASEDVAPQHSGVTVKVSLASALRSAVSPDDTVFIYAVPVDGSRMPLAVSRNQVRDLPLSINLNDSMAMGPMAKISSQSEVKIIARVSKSGAPTPQPGDMETIMSPVTVGSMEPISVEIATLIQ